MTGTELAGALPDSPVTYNRGMKLLQRINRNCGIFQARWVVAALTVGWFDLLAGDALAQKRATLPEESDTLIRYGVMIAIVVLIGLTAFLNPKRSHQA